MRQSEAVAHQGRSAVDGLEFEFMAFYFAEMKNPLLPLRSGAITGGAGT